MLTDQCPEIGRVVEMNGVAEFMDKHISHQIVGKKQKFTIEADGFLSRTTAPDSFLSSNCCSLEGKFQLFAHFRYPRNQMNSGPVSDPLLQRGLTKLMIGRG